MIYPISYFGSIRYFKAISNDSSVVIDIHEHFPKQTYRNRMEILSANGIQALSIPVIKTNGSKTLIKDIQIDYSTDWQKDHWKAIESAYKASPYFDYFGIEVKELIMNNYDSLLDICLESIQKVNDWLNLQLHFTNSTEFINYSDKDFRIVLSSKKEKLSPIKSPYIQTFDINDGFSENLSILDAIFCEGPTFRPQIITS